MCEGTGLDGDLWDDPEEGLLRADMGGESKGGESVSRVLEWRTTDGVIVLGDLASVRMVSLTVLER